MGGVHADERSGEKVYALKCLAAWLKLDSAETQEALMSAGTFKASQVRHDP